MRTIAVVNEKGGTGKTTTAVNLAAALGRAGHRTLLVDLDGQAAASRWVSVEEDHRLAEAIIRGGGLEPIPDVLPGVSLAPSSGKLDSIAHELRPTQGGQLRRALAPLSDDYEYALIDCPPSLGNRLIGNALLAASHAIVPVEPSVLALDGLRMLLTTLQDVRDGFDHPIELIGVVVCRFETRTRLSRLVLAELNRALPGHVFATTVRETVRMQECPASGESILTFSPDCNAAEDYLALAEELLAGGPAASAEARAAEGDLLGHHELTEEDRDAVLGFRQKAADLICGRRKPAADFDEDPDEPTPESPDAPEADEPPEMGADEPPTESEAQDPPSEEASSAEGGAEPSNHPLGELSQACHEGPPVAVEFVAAQETLAPADRAEESLTEVAPTANVQEDEPAESVDNGETGWIEENRSPDDTGDADDSAATTRAASASPPPPPAPEDAPEPTSGPSATPAAPAPTVVSVMAEDQQPPRPDSTEEGEEWQAERAAPGSRLRKLVPLSAVGVCLVAAAVAGYILLARQGEPSPAAAEGPEPAAARQTLDSPSEATPVPDAAIPEVEEPAEAEYVAPPFGPDPEPMDDPVAEVPPTDPEPELPPADTPEPMTAEPPLIAEAEPEPEPALPEAPVEAPGPTPDVPTEDPLPATTDTAPQPPVEPKIISLGDISLAGWTSVKVSCVLESADRPQAILNGQIVSVGQRVGDGRLVGVVPSGVEIELDGKTHTVAVGETFDVTAGPQAPVAEAEPEGEAESEVEAEPDSPAEDE